MVGEGGCSEGEGINCIPTFDLTWLQHNGQPYSAKSMECVKSQALLKPAEAIHERDQV